MNCDEARGLRVDSLMDQIGRDDAARLEAHERDCPGCAAASEEITRLWKVLARIDPPQRQPDALVQFGRRLERHRRSPKRSLVLVAAGIAALVASGVALGRWSATSGEAGSPLTAGPQYLLLLRGTEPDRQKPRSQLVQEYGAWAGDLAAAGALISAGELAVDEARWADPVGDPRAAEARTARVSGFFLVRAVDDDSALALARTSPHVAYGGAIEIRRVITSP